VGRVVRFHEVGGPDVLRVEQGDPGAPGAGEVLVRVAAIGLNRAEASFRSGRYLEQPRSLPARLGAEAAGTVEAVGAGVTGFAPGAEVSVLPTFSMNDYGVYADRAVVPVDSLVPLPGGADMARGAAVWMPYLTAYGALVDIACVGAGDVVAITAASSSVGLAAIQLCLHLGAVPVAVTRTAGKAAALRAAGAAEVVVTEEEETTGALLRHSGGAGVRLVFDPVAGPGVADLAAATAPGGVVVVYGSLSGQETPFPRVAVAKGLVLRGYTVFELTRDAERRRRGVRFVNEGLVRGWLRPTIDRTFALDDIVAAHHYLESNRQVGKIVVEVG